MQLLKFFILSISLLLLPCSTIADENPATVKSVDAQDLQKMIKEEPDNILIVDVRTPGEFNDGHLTDAKNINFFGPRFEQEIANLPNDKQIIVYCKSGRRAEAAAQIMQEAGLKKVSTLKDGISGWKKTGGKLQKD